MSFHGNSNLLLKQVGVFNKSVSSWEDFYRFRFLFFPGFLRVFVFAVTHAAS